MNRVRTKIVALVVFGAALAGSLVPAQAATAPNGYLAKYPWSDCVYLVKNGAAYHLSLDSFNAYRSQGYTYNANEYYIPGERMWKYTSNAAEIFLMQPSTELACPGHHLTYDEFVKAGGSSMLIPNSQFWYKYSNNPTVYERTVFGHAMTFAEWRYYGFPTPVVYSS